MSNNLRGLVVGGLLLCAACADGVAPLHGPLRLDASVNQLRLRIGDTSTVTFRLTNTGADTIRLSFGSSCQILPYVAAEPRGVIVHPAGGAWGCLTVITNLTLAPGAQKSVPLALRGGPSNPSNFREVPLPTGEYVAYARLDHQGYPLQSAKVAIDVR
jgi:hypothetical protein